MRGNPEIKNHGKKFTQDYQPSPEAKSEGKQRVKKIREMINLLSDQVCESVEIGGQVYELSYEAQLILSLYQQAKNGNLRAAAIYLDQVNKCRTEGTYQDQPVSLLEEYIRAAKGVKLSSQLSND